MNTNAVYAKLAQLAPNVNFKATRTVDESYIWDGDGLKPKGRKAHDVDVTATTVSGGEIVARATHLAGCYYRSVEPIGDVHGYLLQMLREAAEELQAVVTCIAVRNQLEMVKIFLKKESQERYDAQRAEIEAERAKTE